MLTTRILAALPVLLTVTAMDAAAAATKAEGVLTIGLAAPITGDNALLNESEGARCMADLINAKAAPGDMRVEVLVGDGKSSDDESLKVVDKFLDAGAIVVHGNPFPSAIVPMSELALAKGAMVYSPMITQVEMHSLDLVNFVAGTIPDDILASGMASAAYTSGARNAALFITEQTDSWTASTPQWFGSAFENLGGKVVGKVTYDTGASDFTTQVAEVTAMSPAPDVVNICNVGSRVATLAKQLKAAGYKGLITGCDGLDDAALETEIGDPALRDQIMFATHVASIPGTPGGDFLKACQSKGFKASTTFDVLGAEMVELLATAAKQAGTTRDGMKLMQSIRATSRFTLFSGATLSFTGATYPTRPAVVIGYRNGERHVVWNDNPEFIPASK